MLGTTSLSEDLVDPSRGMRVPIVTVTDGHWIWSGGHAYYLQEYGLALEPEFHEHIRAQNYRANEPERRPLRTRRSSSCANTSPTKSHDDAVDWRAA